MKVTEVSEVLNDAEVVPLPRSPELFDGIFQLRGRVVGLFNLRKLLNPSSTALSQILVLSEPHQQFAVRVPGTVESRTLKENTVDLRETEAGDEDLLEGIVFDGEEIFHILSLSKIFTHAEMLIQKSHSVGEGGVSG